MSSFTAQDFATVQVTIWAKYYEFSSLVLFIYDTLLTLGGEVQHIWKRKFSTLTLLWTLNRWVIFVACLPNVIFFQIPSLSRPSICKHFFRYPSYTQIFQRMLAGAVFTIRTYCIYGRRLGPALLLVALFAIEFGVKIFVTQEWALPLHDPWGFIGCALEPGRPHLFVIYFIPELLADIVVLSLALLRARQLNTRLGEDSAWLWRELIRGNIFYFFAMTVSNIATILMHLLAPPSFKEVNAYYGIMLNSVLISRLILNLRQATPLNVDDRKRDSFSNVQWERRAVDRFADDFDDTVPSHELHLLDRLLMWMTMNTFANVRERLTQYEYVSHPAFIAVAVVVVVATIIEVTTVNHPKSESYLRLNRNFDDRTLHLQLSGFFLFKFSNDGQRGVLLAPEPPDDNACGRCMSALHAYFFLRNQQAFQRLLSASKSQQQPSNTPALSSSSGKSWSRPSQLSGPASVDVNARDNLGRTVLHIAASCPASDTGALEYVKILLSHPKIDVNTTDAESRWTPLHRALYQGNLPAAVLLLQRTDIDTTLKDLEGYTAADVYNATLEGTKPSLTQPRDLYTWGTNRNANLCTSDADERTSPDYVRIQPLVAMSENASLKSLPLALRFSPARVLDVSMSNMHTVVLTEEPIAKKLEESTSTPSPTISLRICGVGSNGRLGSISQHTHYTLSPLPETQLKNEAPIHSVALGTDHTLVLTEDGVVLSFGSNRFSQLGYVIDSTGVSGTVSGASGSGGQGQQIQLIPRRIGSLKKEFVKGIAACRMASACWTVKECFTWGTNTGQLGYDKAAQPVQIQPRRVPQLTQPIVDIALSDLAMCVLFASRDVLCLWGGRSFKINFPASTFPPKILAYRPPMSQNSANIAKIVSCDNCFAALSSYGEIFTFSLGHPSEASPHKGPNNVSASTLVKPQRIWALRKQFSAVRDVALGSDGTVVLCTEAGHVYVRQRLGKGLNLKFNKVNGLQRVVRVAASESGAFAALRADCSPPLIKVPTALLQTDIGRMRPWQVIPGQAQGDEILSPACSSKEKAEENSESTSEESDDDSTEEDDSDNTSGAFREMQDLLDILEADGMRRQNDGKGLYDYDLSSASDSSISLPGHWRFGGGAHGADLRVRVGSARMFEFPAHSMLLSARSEPLATVLENRGDLRGNGPTSDIGVSYETPAKPGTLEQGKRLVQAILFTGVHPFSVLTLSHYLYTDTFPAILHHQISPTISERLRKLPPTSAYSSTHRKRSKEVRGVSVDQIRNDLRTLAALLNLDALLEAAEFPHRHICESRLARDLGRSFMQGLAVNETAAIGRKSGAPDVILQLADNEVKVHSLILRARSPYFSGFFDEPVWTEKRWSSDGLLYVNLQHIHDKLMRYVIRWIYEDPQEQLFENLDFCRSVDEVLNFMFEIIDVASELLLDPLILICSSVILKFVNIHNACSILADAHYYNAHALVTSLYGYISLNMETLLEARAFDDLSSTIVQGLASHVRNRQAEKLPITRSGDHEVTAMKSMADWYASQDIPEVIVPSEKKARERTRSSSRISPLAETRSNTVRPTPTLGQVRESSTVNPNTVSLTPREPNPELITTGLIRERTLSHISLRQEGNTVDDIFAMDPEEVPPSELSATSSTDPPPRPITPTLPRQGAPTSATTSPWKNRTFQHPAGRVDLRAIMAEAETSRNIETKPGPSLAVPTGRGPARPANGTGQTPPNIPRPGASQQKVQVVGGSDKTNGPWRQLPSNTVSPVQKPTPLGAGPNLPSGLSRALQSQGSSNSATQRSFSQPTSVPVTSQPDAIGKGKSRDTSTTSMHIPSRKPAGPSSTGIGAVSLGRRVSDGNGNPWALAFPSLPPAQTQDNTSSSPPSFLAIQQQQLQSGNVTKQKKSLLEIQKEERERKLREEEAAEARVVEEEFMRWWAAEEDRIKRETQATPGPPVGISGGTRGRDGGSKKKGNGGGRGKGKEKTQGHNEQGPAVGSSRPQPLLESRERLRDGHHSRPRHSRGGKSQRPSDAQPQQA